MKKQIIDTLIEMILTTGLKGKLNLSEYYSKKLNEVELMTDSEMKKLLIELEKDVNKYFNNP